MSKIHLLIPMSGQGTRYQKAGYSEPKPLIPVNGTPMIERLLESFPLGWPCVFVMNSDHKNTKLPELLKKLRPDATQIFIAPHSEGPGLAIEAGLKTIPHDAPVLVSYCDYGMQWNAKAFEKLVTESSCDACIVSYKGFHAHYLNPTTYAYSRLEGDRVVEVREKGSFTDNRQNEYASNGAYYFKSAAKLSQALEYQKEQSLKLNGESYTSLTIQALLVAEPKSNVRVFEIPTFYQWGTPEDLKTFEYWEQAYQAQNKYLKEARPEVSQILMPMAGAGSRFVQMGLPPKPLIEIQGRAMYEQALATLPKAKLGTTLVVLESFSSKLKATANTNIVALTQTPPGQALSTAKGLASLRAGSDVIVSSCDHGIVINPATWKSFRDNPMCDAAIFTIAGYPGAARKPKAFAYMRDAKDTSAFPLVSGVSVKEPISAKPTLDPLLVGTFWFSSPDILQKGIELLVAADKRVNGELYLDSIFELLIEKGRQVRRIPLDSYLCWGDPDSLLESQYYFEAFNGLRI
jgi:NDP-sugar pyrophosphorylase family protein